MNAAEIEVTLKARGCAIVADGGRFALVYPHGYEARKRAKDLLATDTQSALIEAWLWLHPDQGSAQRLAAVVAVVAADFAMLPAALIERDRSEPLATARRIAMALAREFSGETWQAVADHFGRDHGAVIHAASSVRDQCDVDAAFAARVGTLRAACAAAVATLPGEEVRP